MNGNVTHAIFLLCLVLASACGPSLAPLDTAIQKGNWDVATTYAGENKSLQLYLATVIVQHEAKESKIPKSLVLALPVSHPYGEKALRQLADDGNHPDVAHLAQIVRHRTKGSQLSVKVINRYLKSHHRDVRALAATTFSDQLDNKTLHAMTRDINGTVRAAAVAALCRRPRDAKTAELLTERLQNDPLPHVRAAAARCGSGLGPNRSLLLKRRIEKENNPGVRLAAAEGLLSIAGKKDITWLTRFCSGPMTPLRLRVAAALAHRHLPGGKARLADALMSGDDQIVAEAISLLSYGHIADINTLLRPRLETRPAISTAAASLLLARGEHVADAVKTLTRNWKNGDERALAALVRANNEDALEYIRVQLKTETHILNIINTYESVSGLRGDFVALLAHPDTTIRMNAALAILKQHGK